jgi:CHAT domain-containing protein
MLWEVGDEAAHRFMRLFYEQISAGAPYSLAYQIAQREFLGGDAFDRDGRYWGAFTLTSKSHSISAGLPT